MNNPDFNKPVWEPVQADARTEPIECALYSWFKSHCAQLQAEYAKTAKPELKERAVHYWRLILNTLGPLAAESRGADYAQHFYAIGDQMRTMATRGETSPGIIQMVENQLRAGQPRPKQLPSILTGRRREIAVLVARGCTDGEIAESLGIGRATVGMHIRHLLCYAHARNRTQMVRRLLESGELPREEDEQTILAAPPKPKLMPAPKPPATRPYELVTVKRAVGRPIPANREPVQWTP